MVKLIKQDPKAPSDPSFYGVSEGPYRYAFPVDNLMLAGAVPVIKPPYNTFTAIDLNKGDLLWQIPLGDSPQIRNHPLLKGLSLPPLGGTGNEGVLVTGGGLVFAGTADKKFCAIDKTSGKIIWQGDLEFASAGSPMTYRTRAGRQFVVVATGAGKNATLVAFALPQ